MRPSPNRLAQCTSPYLLQHAHNPVDWHPWGPEALALARELGRPIFLSIGYSACHWCHVMERESFEDPGTAAVLNAHFVPIKVDREERPDLDDLYMGAVHAITGRGGWPMSVWLTPDLEPFYGGTYFPPTPRYGMPAFAELLRRIAQVWKERPGEIAAQAGQLTEHLRAQAQIPPGDGLPDPGVFARAMDQLYRAFDSRWGGFGGAPKFPPIQSLRLLLARGGPEEVAMAARTLTAMRRGGIYDHLGGGFARYSVDERWMVPHFEKMLYDNAQLAVCYLEAHRVTGEADFAVVARETLEYLLRDMRLPEGGFCSSEDADSEGGEGRFYLFDPAQVREVLGEVDGQRFCQAFDITAAGNFEGRSILHRLEADPESSAKAVDEDPGLDAMRAQLLAIRQGRIRPHRDDKVLAAWNGLALQALSMGFQILGDRRYLEAATECARFLEQALWRDGGLHRTWRGGLAHTPAFLEDHGALILGLVELYESGFEARWLRWAEALAEAMLREFQSKAGDFWSTGTPRGEAPDLLFRQRPIDDGFLPSGNALAIHALLRLGRHLERNPDRPDLVREAERALGALSPGIEGAPWGRLGLLLSLDLLGREGPEVLVSGSPEDPRTHSLLRAAWMETGPGRSLSLVHSEDPPWAQVCRDRACQAPVFTEEALVALLRA